ncbi:MAG: Succinate--CoA ligase [ADP-forming] subunit beta [Chlamydiia bacterium]|nr:Succinate--CoA ligase [ADP-forming] subunit beta [Chlamydiia bacterium]MCH9615214.1 Succinate--CoA ligase [ADP-forming] subunit beta [Chlamydiia bacterium]MCH9628464.1 Succinate--CoA ligase [ADP-forming] subunit beta [Chlamydiia bacterium]
MNTHEYQAKEVLAKYGMPIPEFGVASSTEEAKAIVDRLGLSEAVIKIQVHAGGRGKAGGVKFGKSKAEIVEKAQELIGMKMVNNQTGPQGVIAKQVLITVPVDIAKEYYIGAIIDRENAQPIIIASPEGGMEIEEIAEKTPEKILKLPIRMDGTLKGYELMRLAKFMGWKGPAMKQGMKVTKALAKAFMDVDGDLLEINPLCESPNGDIWVVDAKLSIDDNALYRHPELASYYDPSQVSESEVEANKYDLAYISLEGNIGCMVNGAGLAMSTMDIIHHYGGKPANFLDVGGSATKEKVAAGFKIILSDPEVKAIVVNIFGGIMNCATIAEGVIAAASEMTLDVPLIVRLEGTNVDEGRRLIRESGLKITPADGMADAAEKAVKALGN